MLEPWVERSVLLPCCSSWFICTWMWDCPVCKPSSHLVCQPLPSHKSSPPRCPSPSLLPVWMNVSSLTPWLSDFYTVQFSGSSCCFFVFKFVVILLLVVQGGKVYLPMHPSWLEVLWVSFFKGKVRIIFPVIYIPWDHFHVRFILTNDNNNEHLSHIHGKFFYTVSFNASTSVRLTRISSNKQFNFTLKGTWKGTTNKAQCE